jgi:lysophospholipase L1-like esterase
MTSLYVRLRRRVAYAVSVRRFAREPIADGDIVFLGDSITAQGSWAEWFPAQSIKVRGIGGDTARGVLARVDQVLGHPAGLFLMVGTNDVADGLPTERIVATVGDIVATIVRSSPATVLFVQSVTPRTAEMAPAIRAVNAGLAGLAAGVGATYVELFDLLCDERGALRPGFSHDALHLQPDAYDIWHHAVAPLVTTSHSA